MTNQEIIDLLQLDIQGEHQAIVMYLMHAYELGEGEYAAEIEAVAREEMRHLDWLADKIVGLGGKPVMEPIPPDFHPLAPSEQMLKDVGLEEGAVYLYREHIEAISDPSIRLVLSRILHDELAHRDIFAKLAEEMRDIRGVIAEANAAGHVPPERLSDILNEGIRHEYTVTLQYLFHGFMTEDKDLAEDFQNIAINEMQHMGWLSEALAARGGRPEFSHTDMVLTPDAETNIKADIAVEREVTQAYSKQIPELGDAGLVKLVERIRDHEIFHDNQFGELLAEVEAEEHAEQESAAEPEPQPKQKPTIPTVGSLKK